MGQILLNSILATIFISVISLVGVVTIFINKKIISRISIYFVAFSAGALIGGAFLHLLPEAIDISGDIGTFLLLIVGIVAFFVLERFLKWHHCHEEGCPNDKNTYTHMSLIGDAFHNLIDGIVIASSFVISVELGIATTLAVAAHELPQELGDFGLLIHGGFSRNKALFWNFVSSLAAVIGAVIGCFMAQYFDNLAYFLLPFTAGGFLYIAMSDLIPEIHKETKASKSILNFVLFTIGILFMLFIKLQFND